MSGFKVRARVWHPYLPPVEMAEASAEQRAAMQVTPSNTKVSPYVRTLAHDPESYVARTTLYNQVMYGEGGLDNRHRELGALVASAVNGCGYCASVHARRHMALAGSDAIARAVYLEGLDAEFDPLTRAIVDFARALSQTPVAATPAQVQALRDQGLSAAEIADLIQSVAMFAWANRLMHTLGHSTPQT